MKLEVIKDDITKNMAPSDIVFAALEAKDAFLLVDMMENAREDNHEVQKEIFLNASSALKKEIKNLANGSSSIKFDKFDLNAEPKQHTFAFAKRKYTQHKPVVLNLSGNTFADLQNAVIETNDPNAILSFARSYKVNNEKFLNALEQLGEVYAKAYRRDVLKDHRLQKDELQLYM